MATCGTITVEEPKASISIQGCSISPSSGPIDPTDTVEAVVELVNNGDAFGSVTVTFLVDGNEFGSRSIGVNAGSTASVAEQFQPDDFSLVGTISIEASITGSASAAAQRGGLFADGGRQFGLSRTKEGCATCGN